MKTTGSYKFAEEFFDKHSIFFKLHELQNLMYIFNMASNMLTLYTEALNDVKIYVIAAMASDNYVESTPTSFKYVIYRQMFEDLKSPM